jgi:hypothetical protein
MGRLPINWSELAEHAGIVTRFTAGGGRGTNQGSEEARRALEWLIGEDNIRSGVELWLARRLGEEAAASAAWSVLMYIRSRRATELAYEAYRRARSEGRPDDAALAVILIDDICHPSALDWVDEFLDYEPTANAGVGLVDQALFHGAIYPDDERLENWLRTADAKPDPYIQEAVQRIRQSMAQWPKESEGERQASISKPPSDLDTPPRTAEG